MAPEVNAPAPPNVTSAFEDWRAATQKVHDISTFVNAHSKLKYRLRQVMELDQFKEHVPLMPLTRNWGRFRSVVFMLARFLKIADQLVYLFCHGDGILAFQALGPPLEDTGARIKRVSEYGAILQSNVLQETARTIIAWLSPLYEFEGWADGIYESSFFHSCLKWDTMARVQHDQHSTIVSLWAMLVGSLSGSCGHLNNESTSHNACTRCNCNGNPSPCK